MSRLGGDIAILNDFSQYISGESYQEKKEAKQIEERKLTIFPLSRLLGLHRRERTATDAVCSFQFLQ
jgi:hypothetical protein